MTLAAPPPCQTLLPILEHWNIGTNSRKCMILLKKSCSKRFFNLEQTLQTPWNKTSHKVMHRVIHVSGVMQNLLVELVSVTGFTQT